MSGGTGDPVRCVRTTAPRRPALPRHAPRARSPGDRRGGGVATRCSVCGGGAWAVAWSPVRLAATCRTITETLDRIYCERSQELLAKTVLGYRSVEKRCRRAPAPSAIEKAMYIVRRRSLMRHDSLTLVINASLYWLSLTMSELCRLMYILLCRTRIAPHTCMHQYRLRIPGA